MLPWELEVLILSFAANSVLGGFVQGVCRRWYQQAKVLMAARYDSAVAIPFPSQKRQRHGRRDDIRPRKKRKTVRQQQRTDGNQAGRTKELGQEGYFDLLNGTCQWTSSWETEKKVSATYKVANVYQASLTIRFRLEEPSRRAEYADTNKPASRGGEDRFRQRKVQHISLAEFIKQGATREESPCHKFVRELSIQPMIVCPSPSL